MKVFAAYGQPTTSADAARYSGAVWIDPVADGEPPARLHADRVRFAPGARTAWHTHPMGQMLLVLDGVGLVQQDGCRAVRLTAGDAVAVAPGERHWHGATPEHSFVHIAVQGPDHRGCMADWHELLADADYRAAADNAGAAGSPTQRL